MRISKIIVLASVSVALCACASHTKDYLKKGTEIPPIVVPNDVPVIKQKPYYPIPPVSAQTPTAEVSLTPPTLQKKSKAE